MYPDIRQILTLLEMTEGQLRRIIHGFGQGSDLMKRLDCQTASLNAEFSRTTQQLTVSCGHCHRQLVIGPDSLKIG